MLVDCGGQWLYNISFSKEMTLFLCLYFVLWAVTKVIKIEHKITKGLSILVINLITSLDGSLFFTCTILKLSTY